jgi:hypothetical protein
LNEEVRGRPPDCIGIEVEGAAGDNAAAEFDEADDAGASSGDAGEEPAGGGEMGGETLLVVAVSTK